MNSGQSDRDFVNVLIDNKPQIRYIDDEKFLVIGFSMYIEYTYTDMRPEFMDKCFEKILLTIIDIANDGGKNIVTFSLNRQNGVVGKLYTSNEYIFVWDTAQNILSTKQNPTSFFYATLFFKNKPIFEPLSCNLD
ncbi:putative orfan [Tupanvirus soda lake]|uniref:Orfan n=2 Tax=Tupanvirus TaxID=2094720 RepID=A0AC62AAR1_9VIRU|nr:putative orfan [Tupanvirus soda lake]QKU34789.1 putative orfan [Tupanvirus soda lake]